MGRTTPDESGFVAHAFSNGRSATTHGVTTMKLNYNAGRYRASSAANLATPSDAPFDHEYVAGDVRVTRASTNNYHGYASTDQDCALAA